MKFKLFILGLFISININAAQIDQIFSVTQKTDNNSHNIAVSKQVNKLAELPRLAVEVPEIGIHNFTVQKKYTTNEEQVVWLGEGRDHSFASLIQSKYGLSGSIRTKDGIWQIRPTKGGGSQIIKFDKSQYQKTTDVIEPYTDIHKHAGDHIDASPAAFNSTPFQTIQTQAPQGFTESNDIRVLAYYSSDAINDYPNLRDLIELEFADANQAFVNSNINATLTLAGFIEISDYGTENNLYDMLARDDNFARMDEAKEKYDADLVHFFGENLGWVCGIAYYSANSSGWVDPEFGVGATASSCLGSLTFAHEVGHNLGARHDRYVENGGTSDYAYGYVDLENEFQTLMSYRDNCSDNGKSCTEITHFSNPDINYNDQPTGIAITEAEAANNATLLQKTTPLVANYTGVGYPGNFTVSKGTEANKVILNWDSMTGADGYELKRYQLSTACPDYNSLNTIYTTTTELSLTIDSTGDSSQYCYWLRAYKDYPHGARMYSAPTPVEIGYGSSRSIHISDIQPIHITNEQSVVTIDFTTNQSTTVSASIVEANASDWLTAEVSNTSGNQYRLTLTNTSEISASAIVVIEANGTKEYLPVQFSGYTNTAPVINVEETVNIPQAGSVSTSLIVTDDGGADKVILNYYSEDTSFIGNSQISIVNSELRVNLTHSLIGSASVIVTAFDGEMLTRKRVTFNVIRSNYNRPHIPEEVTLYVDGEKAITRRLPGYSIDADELTHTVRASPQNGSLTIDEGKFTYTPTSFSGTDSFVLESQLVANGDDNMPQDVYQTRFNLVPFTQVQLPFQQYIFGNEYARLLLTHRGQIWKWGRHYTSSSEREWITTPTLQLEGKWVSAVYLNGTDSIVLLKADGTLWMSGSEYLYSQQSGLPFFTEPKQIGTDRDWNSLSFNKGTESTWTVLLTKTDGSLWIIGAASELLNGVDQVNQPTQVTGLYHWQESTESVLLDMEGKVWTFSNYLNRELGRDETGSLIAPIELPEKATKVTGDIWRNYAYTKKGIYGWGKSLLLDDNRSDALTPTLLNNEEWKNSSFSTYYFSAVNTEGELFTSGINDSPTLGRGEGAIGKLSKVGEENDWLVSYSHVNDTYAIKADGSIWVAGGYDGAFHYWYILGLAEDEYQKQYFDFTQLPEFPEDTFGELDNDNDGILNFEDIDDDNDCIIDSLDPEPDVADSSDETCLDTDGDGIVNGIDEDDDNDGVVDVLDAFPLDASESVDTDNDGIGNNADTDDDNDGVPDESDAFPLDATESVDTDGDGIGNNADTDDDGDGVSDEEDTFPLDASESVDTDSDGIGNNADTDDDNDGVSDEEDAFPLDAAESIDTDKDGIGNNADTDDDGDGVSDEDDAFPLNATESVDTDGDGIGNNADTDDDGDGVADTEDPFPLDASRSVVPTNNVSESSGGGGSTSVLLVLLAMIAVYRFKLKSNTAN